MVMLLVVVLLTVALSHALVEPLAVVLRPLLDLSWLGWALLLLLAWLLAGGITEAAPTRPENADPGADQG
jgi:hypothetical protein